MERRKDLVNNTQSFRNERMTPYLSDFPWVYDLGRELVEVLKSKSAKEAKADAIKEFKNMFEFTLGHPLLREMYGERKANIQKHAFSFLSRRAFTPPIR